MRAVRIVDGTPTLETLAGPEGDGVRVKVVSSSICGSDLHLLDGGIAEGMILGHEFCGIAPDGVHFDYISEGGIGLPGGMADEIIVHPGALVALPSGLTLEHACLVEPLAVATHALDRARVTDNDRVLVIGAGPIGLAAAAMLRHRGIPGTVSARHPHQQAAAERLGASLDVGDGYDVVIDAVATSASIGEAVHRARPMGRVGLVGTTWQPAELGIAACMKEIEILPAMTYRCRVPGRDFDEAAAALAAAPDIGPTIITDRFPLDGCVEAFATAADRSSGTIKVAFDL